MSHLSSICRRITTLGILRDGVTLLAAMAASLLPFRLWGRLPASFQMTRAAFASGLLVFFLGAAVGRHARHTDLEAVRKSVQYDMPDAHPRD
jgi:hypothetical protein